MCVKTPHVHAALIKAWAEGCIIQARIKTDGKGWFDVANPNWAAPWMEFRVKPEPKPDVTVSVSVMRCSGSAYIVAFKHNLELTFDGETDKLKSAEVINA